jgi:hypothetical protein
MSATDTNEQTRSPPHQKTTPLDKVEAEDEDEDEVAGEVAAGATGPGLEQEEATQEEDHCRKRFSETPMA